MAWVDVEAALSFYYGQGDWNIQSKHTMDVVDIADQIEITAHLQNLYNGSYIAASIIDQIVAQYGTIRIGTAAGSNMAPAFFARATSWSYIGISLDRVANTHFFTESGTFVQERPDIALIHELAHLVGYMDPEHN